MIIETAHLILRPWRDSDRPAFAEQNADPLVMRFLTGVLTREESDAYVDRAEKHQAETGFCKWAVEAPGIAPFIGAVGLSHVKFDASFTPAVEVASASPLLGACLCDRGRSGGDRRRVHSSWSDGGCRADSTGKPGVDARDGAFGHDAND